MARDRRDYHKDVQYEVWRSGRNPDRLDYDRVEDHRLDGTDAYDAARCEMRRWRAQEERRQMERYQEEADLIQAEQEYYEMEDAKQQEEFHREYLMEQEYGPRIKSTGS